MIHVHLSDRRGRAALFSSIAVVALILGTPAAAAGPHVVDIPAGPLDAALRRLAAETHEQLLFAPDLVAGRHAPAVAGALTTEQALARLLAASGIVATRTGPEVLVLRAAPTTAGLASAQAEPRTREVAGARPFAAEPGEISAAPGRGADIPLARRLGPPAPPTTVAEIQVTGTHIRGSDAGASPVAVIDHADLDRLGQITVAEGLSVLPQNFSGQNTEVSAVTFSDNRGVNSAFGTGVNLRGLGSNATLVLVDGRRLGGAGANGDFADISTLPNIAVSRVEVLLDGASAIYGSDAVGGVVNILMRRNLDGGEARVQYGSGPGGAPHEAQLGLVAGHTWRGGGVVAAYEAYHRTALVAADRDFAASPDLRPLGGSDFRTTFAHPGNILVGGVPTFGIPAGQNGLGLTAASFQSGVINLGNSHEGLTILPDQERQSGYLSVHQQLGERLQLSGDAIYGFRAARHTQTPPNSTFTVTPADPFFVSPVGATTESLQYKFSGELPSPIARATAETLALTGGATWDLGGDWRSDSFVDFGQEIEEGHTTGALNTTLLAEALGNVADRPTTAFSPARDGFFNPFTGIAGANRASVLSAIGSGFVVTRRESRVTTVSTQADGTIWRLPGGPLKLAIGAQYRHEHFVRGGSSYTSTVAPVAQQGTDVTRTVGAVFGEVRAPLFGPDNARPGLQRLELSGAVRWEHYGDFGSTTNPKLGVLWSPVHDLNLRATYGRSFRAPGLRDLFDPASNSSIHVGSGAAAPLILLENGGNPGLRPETAQTWTVGGDWQPQQVPGLRVSGTWFSVDYSHRIDVPVGNFLSTVLTDPAFTTFVRKLDPNNAADQAAVNALLANPLTIGAGQFPASAYVAIVDGRTVNTGELKVEGLDLTASYAVDAGSGRWTLAANASDLLRYDQALTPTSASLGRAGLVGFPPRFRGRFTVDWTHGPLTLGAALNQTSAFHDSRGGRLDALTTADLQARLVGPPDSRWAGLTVAVTARNLFDAAPPFYNNPLGYGFDPANADVIGRFVSLQLSKSW